MIAMIFIGIILNHLHLLSGKILVFYAIAMILTICKVIYEIRKEYLKEE